MKNNDPMTTMENLVGFAYRLALPHVGDGDELGEMARECMDFLAYHFPKWYRELENTEEGRG